MQAARDSLGLTFAYIEAFEAEAEAMIDTTVTDAQFFEAAATVFGQPAPDAPARTRNAARRRDAVLAHLWHDAPTQDGIRGTAWAAYQARGVRRPPRPGARQDRRRHRPRHPAAHHRRTRPRQGPRLGRPHPRLTGTVRTQGAPAMTTDPDTSRGREARTG